MKKTLICTVGTGNIDDLTMSLLEPLKKSIREGEWETVVLLPSQLTAHHAEGLCAEIGDVAIESRPLPEPKQEDNADACFAHFDRVIAELRNSGLTPDSIVADFTRGTKAMSAALVLAAVRHRLPLLRYISGTQRDQRGMVVPGTEIVTEFRTTVATARRSFDDAMSFFRHGNFAAVNDLLNDERTKTWPDDLCHGTTFLRNLARFYAAWDRLDYIAAIKHANTLFPYALSEFGTIRFDGLVPTIEIVDWVKSLGTELPDGCKDKSGMLRHLMIDLFANGERRVRDHQYEDALLRAYRVLELLGQVRLFDCGYDSAALPPDDEKIKSFQDSLLKKKSEPLTSNRKDGYLQAPREKVARLLKHLGDDFGNDLLKAAEAGEVKVKSRNQSVLIHGFDAVAGSQPEPLAALYGNLEQLIVLDIGKDCTFRENLSSGDQLSQALPQAADFS